MTGNPGELAALFKYHLVTTCPDKSVDVPLLPIYNDSARAPGNRESSKQMSHCDLGLNHRERLCLESAERRGGKPGQSDQCALCRKWTAPI